MASFTGPEIAALIDAGCIIAAHEAFSAELERQLVMMPVFMRARLCYEDWIRGVYLITSVEQEEPGVTIPIDSKAVLDEVRNRMNSDTTLTIQGRRLRLAASHSLEGTSPASLASAFAELTPPCTISLSSEVSCGDDHVVAVNLTRPMDPPNPMLVERTVSKVCKKYKGAARVVIQHMNGGPCDNTDLTRCLVLGGAGCGWTLVKDLSSAIELAYSRCCKRSQAEGAVCGGQTVRLRGLQACPELNGELGIALWFAEASGRWLVRLRNGDGKKLKPSNLEGLEGESGRVFAFWGDARWSRAQLLGEIAKGDWGLCRANIGDLAMPHTERWKNTADRVAFAPITEMSESYMRAAQQEMDAVRATVQMHNPGPPDEAEPSEA